MFTKQVGQLDQIAQAGEVGAQVAEVLRSLLGNCQQTLEHRGQTVLDGTHRANNETDPLLWLKGGFLRFAPRFPPEAVGWAVAIDNWDNNGGDMPFVDCDKAQNKDGDLFPKPDRIRVFLPRVRPGDPNVRAGAIVPWMKTAEEDSIAICTCDYMDKSIGALDFVSSTSIIPAGWQVADGTNGTVDLIGRFFKGHATTAGTTAAAGSTSSAGAHDHGGATGAGGIHDHTTTTSTETTGITVDDHTDHAHQVTVTGEQTDPGGTSGNTPVTNTWCTTGVMATGCGGAAGSGVLGHTVNDPGHDHDVSVGLSSSHTHSIASGGAHTHTAGDPASVTIIPIQRVS